MSATLEPVETPIEESQQVQEPPEQVQEQVQEPPQERTQQQIQEQEQPVQAPQPKMGGRPKKQYAPNEPTKAVIISKPPVSSSDEEPINKDDMETMLMNYLLQRKQAQQNARRTMWAQMAGLSGKISFKYK